MKYLITLMLFFSPLLATHYTVDPQHSRVQFSVRHLIFTTVTGDFKHFSGSYDINNSLLTDLNGSVGVASVKTPSKKRNRYLISKAFFDAKKYPKMTMKMLYLKGDQVIAELTIKGVTNQIPLKVTYTEGGVHLQGEMSRKAYGLTWGKTVETAGLVVSDTVKIFIDLKGIAQK